MHLKRDNTVDKLVIPVSELVAIDDWDEEQSYFAHKRDITKEKPYGYVNLQGFVFGAKYRIICNR